MRRCVASTRARAAKRDDDSIDVYVCVDLLNDSVLE